MNEHNIHGYDSREYFVKELMIRVHNFLNGSPQNPREWFESLKDYYSFVVPALDSRDKFKERFKHIKNKIYGKKQGDRYLTEQEKKALLEECYEDIRDLFEEMHLEVYNREWYVPIKKHRNPRRAVANYYD